VPGRRGRGNTDYWLPSQTESGNMPKEEQMSLQSDTKYGIRWRQMCKEAIPDGQSSKCK